jgi:KDO2-lipid IV(A) lauroyltransferase
MPATAFMGTVLGKMLSYCKVGRLKVPYDSMVRSFSASMSEDELKSLHRKMLTHFARMIFEIPHILRLNEKNMDQYVFFENEDHYLNALKKGKGILALTGHFGNWEFTAAAVSLKFGPLAMVARPVDSKAADLVINDIRTRFGSEVIPKQRGMRKILYALRRNLTVGVLLDQNVDWYEGVFVNFLGRQACTNKGLALLALKTGSPVVPIFSARQRDGRYCIMFGEEIQLKRTGDKTRDVEENTAVFTSIIEKYIRMYPEQWFWFHRRWKTRPFCPIQPK